MSKALMVSRKEIRRIFTDLRFLLSIILPAALVYIVFVLISKVSSDPTRIKSTILSSLWVFAPALVFLVVGGAIQELVPPSITGEKEAKTLGFTLMTPITNGEFLFGKFLALAFASLVVSLLCLASLVASCYKLVGTLSISPLGVVSLFLLILSVSLFSVSLSFLLSLLSKTVKEAQGYCFGFVGITVVLSLAAARFDLNSWWVPYVPIVNLSCAISSVILGEESALNFSLSVIFSLLYSALVFLLAVRLSKKETVMS